MFVRELALPTTNPRPRGLEATSENAKPSVLVVFEQDLEGAPWHPQAEAAEVGTGWKKDLNRVQEGSSQHQWLDGQAEQD